jgi:hypothetical protein
MPCRNATDPRYQASDAKRDLEAAIAQAQANNREIREHFKRTR